MDLQLQVCYVLCSVLLWQANHEGLSPHICDGKKLFEVHTILSRTQMSLKVLLAWMMSYHYNI